MSRKFSKTSSVKLPQRGREAEGEDFGREKGGIAECPGCHSVHHKKGWHASIEDINVKEGKLFISRRELCPACRMIRENEFEGELLVENIPERLREEVINLLKNFGERAKQKDPQHRIIEIIKHGNGYRITTTENQLAVRMGKKLKDVINTVELHVSHSREPNEVSRVRAVYVGEE